MDRYNGYGMNGCKGFLFYYRKLLDKMWFKILYTILTEFTHFEKYVVNYKNTHSVSMS